MTAREMLYFIYNLPPEQIDLPLFSCATDEYYEFDISGAEVKPADPTKSLPERIYFS